MLYALVGLAAATHVQTFEIDPLYSDGPISGLQSLVVDPALAVSQLRPLEPPYPQDLEKLVSEAPFGDSALVFTNPTSTWAALSINGLLLGDIGPYATMRLENLRRGAYRLTLALPTGMVRELVVRTHEAARPALQPVAVKVAQDRLELSDKIYFELDSSVIDAVSHALLDAVAQALTDNADVLLVRIEGHTDSRGAEDYNQALSERRTASVRDYLVAKGVAADRLAVVGLGETKPVDTADTEAAWESNRRVEFLIEKRAPPPELAPPPVKKPVKKKGNK